MFCLDSSAGSDPAWSCRQPNGSLEVKCPRFNDLDSDLERQQRSADLPSWNLEEAGGRCGELQTGAGKLEGRSLKSSRGLRRGLNV